MRQFHSRFALAFSTLAVLAITAIADAQPAPGMCCVHSTSRLDALLSPVKGGDEKFFTTSSGQPNVIVVLDTSPSMLGWAKPWPTTPGCAHQDMLDLGFDPAGTYPPMWSNLTSPEDRWFDSTKFYSAPDTGCGNNFNNVPSLCTNYATTALACAGMGAGCAACLTSQGYWVENATTRRTSGKFMNFYAPKDSGTAMVMSQIVHDMANLRISVMATRAGAPFNCYTPSGDPSCVCMLADFAPKCGNNLTDAQKNSTLNNLQNKLSWSNTCGANPAGSSLLYGAAAYFRTADPGPDVFDSMFSKGVCSSWADGGCAPIDGDFKETTSTGDTVCADCEFAAILYITAGAGTGANPIIPLPDDITSQTVTCGGCNPNDPDLPKVAKWFWEHDVRTDSTHPRKNRVATYTIGFLAPTDSTNEKLLQKTALVGGGQYYRAESSTQLKEAIQRALDDIATRGNSFAAASIASVQTSSSDLGALLPRMRPQPENPWIGELYRYKLFNEFVENTNFKTDGGDSDKDDVYVVDEDGDIITEDAEGEFVKDYDRTLTADHFWEARERLATNGLAARNIWTTLETSGDGMFTSADGKTAFTVANWAAIGPYLGIVGTNYCPTSAGANGRLLNKMGLNPTDAAAALNGVVTGTITLSGPPTQDELNELCVKVLIQYFRGQDLTDEDIDGSRTDVRTSVLGDIFHSSPMVVDPPVDQFICDLGLHNQCIRTLYASSAELGGPATPSDSYADQTNGACAGTVTRGAYDKYRFEARRRHKLILVGSNDGMIHAFHAGTPATEACVSGLPSADYDQGTGDEKWAFIPPDQLPRLIDRVFGHIYMMDGDIMVRDIWADGSGATAADGEKQYDEFHTMAVVAEGRGGVHYIGLELPFNSDGTSDDEPIFRWIFPQPCSEEASRFGKTFLALSPRPPPIGPVLINASDSAGNPLLGTATTVNRHGVETIERWIVALSGGWSPGLERGRGLYLVDAYWGNLNAAGEGNISVARTDNLWWKMEFDESAPTDQRVGPKAAMTGSVVAPLAMVDYGANGDPKFDGFFDTGIVGDTSGQVWALRFFAPGVLNATNGQVNNWAAARTFQQDKGGVTASPANAASMVNRSPFFFLASVGLQPDNYALRATLGTGNRYDLLDVGAGNCQFDNPAACTKYGCDGQIQSHATRLTQNMTSGAAQTTAVTAETMWTGRTMTANTSVLNTALVGDTCGIAGTISGTAGYSNYAITACTNLTSSPSPYPAQLYQVSGACGQDLAGNYRCRRTDSNQVHLRGLGIPNATALNGVGANRFYGLWAYGGSATRMFDEEATATGGPYQTALEYDGLRKTDRTAAFPVRGDLIDVTDGVTAATTADPGWMIRYSALTHKTASAATLIAGCNLWNVVVPTAPISSTCPSTTIGDARLMQADFITGLPNCAASFAGARFKSQSVSAPPPEPASVMAISADGRIRQVAMMLTGSGEAASFAVSNSGDMLQSVYEVPISRAVHDCRHVSGGNCTTSAP